jgi:hypothetical protein
MKTVKSHVTQKKKRKEEKLKTGPSETTPPFFSTPTKLMTSYMKTQV